VAALTGAVAAGIILVLFIQLTIHLFTPGDELRIAIHGPETLTVGERAVFTATAPRTATLTWITPDGEELTNADPVLDLTTVRPGTGRVTLIATSPTGTQTHTDLDFTVTN
jgi:hypothetical protein